MNRLKQIFEETLEKFDTSDKDDIELLKTLNTNTQQGFQDSLAVTMRLREKQVLAHHIKFIDVALLQASYGTLDKPIFGLNKKMKLALKSYNKTILSKLFENEKTRAA